MTSWSYRGGSQGICDDSISIIKCGDGEDGQKCPKLLDVIFGRPLNNVNNASLF
jgi:hypothetical protein